MYYHNRYYVRTHKIKQTERKVSVYPRRTATSIDSRKIPSAGKGMYYPGNHTSWYGVEKNNLLAACLAHRF